MLTQITLPLRLIVADAADIFWLALHPSYALARTCIKYQPLRAFIVESCLPFSHTPSWNKKGSVYGHPFWLLSTHIPSQPVLTGHTPPWPSSPRRYQYSIIFCKEDIIVCRTFATAVWSPPLSLDLGHCHKDILPYPSATRYKTTISSSNGHTRNDTTHISPRPCNLSVCIYSKKVTAS